MRRTVGLRMASARDRGKSKEERVEVKVAEIVVNRIGAAVEWKRRRAVLEVFVEITCGFSSERWSA